MYLAGVVLCVLGCSEDRGVTGAAAGPVSASSSSGSGMDGGGGSGAGDAVGGAGGSSGIGGNASGVGGGALPPEEPCEIAAGFAGTDFAFVSPTPLDMAIAFNTVTYGYNDIDRPLTVALLAIKGPSMALMATSGSEYDDTDFTQGFPEGKTPTNIAATLGYGFFQNDSPQDVGYLRLTHDGGVDDIELNNLTTKVKTENCQVAVVVVDAIIPVSQSSISLTVNGDATTIGDLGGEVMGGWPVRVLFQGEQVDFDFGTL